jgi:hypothetical protein
VAVLTIPLLILGLIDPLEGGVALLAAAILIAGTRLVSKVPIPRLEWISWVVAMLVGIAAIAWAMLERMAQNQAPGGIEGLPIGVIAMLVIYEIAVVVTVAGGVQYVVRLARSVRHPELAP